MFRSLIEPNSLSPEVKLCEVSVDDTDQNYCLRALQCASELKKRENKHLACHIAVTEGTIKLGVLGGFNDEWSYIINGPCLSELSACIEDAGPKQVVCSKTCYNIATGSHEIVEDTQFDTRRTDLVMAVLCASGSGNYLVKNVHTSKHATNHRMRKSGGMGSGGGTGMGSGSGMGMMGGRSPGTDPPTTWNQSTDTLDGKDNSVRVELSSRVLEAAEYFVPRPALSAIYSASLDSISELRQVTTMFLRLDSYSPLLHQDPISLQPFFYLLQQVLDETGGFLRQFLVDDKVRVRVIVTVRVAVIVIVIPCVLECVFVSVCVCAYGWIDGCVCMDRWVCVCADR